MCGVFGIRAPGRDVARLAYFGMYALQHRGQESAGIAVSDGRRVTALREMGLVAQVFDESKLKALVGEAAIGHTRYSTTGSATWQNSQPIVRHRKGRTVALGHNGNLTNTAELRDELLARGVHLDSTSDTEVICALIAEHPGTPARGDDRGDVEDPRRVRRGHAVGRRGDRLPRPGRHPPARARRPRRLPRARVRDARARHHRRDARCASSSPASS